VPADTDVPVVMVSDPIVLTTFCDVTWAELETLVIVVVWMTALAWDNTTLFNGVADVVEALDNYNDKCFEFCSSYVTKRC
jgi:hypothetical protein